MLGTIPVYKTQVPSENLCQNWPLPSFSQGIACNQSLFAQLPLSQDSNETQEVTPQGALTFPVGYCQTLGPEELHGKPTLLPWACLLLPCYMHILVRVLPTWPAPMAHALLLGHSQSNRGQAWSEQPPAPWATAAAAAPLLIAVAAAVRPGAAAAAVAAAGRQQ